jgi:hypothetical protein
MQLRHQFFVVRGKRHAAVGAVVPAQFPVKVFFALFVKGAATTFDPNERHGIDRDGCRADAAGVEVLVGLDGHGQTLLCLFLLFLLRLRVLLLKASRVQTELFDGVLFALRRRFCPPFLRFARALPHPVAVQIRHPHVELSAGMAQLGGALKINKIEKWLVLIILVLVFPHDIKIKKYILV